MQRRNDRFGHVAPECKQSTHHSRSYARTRIDGDHQSSIWMQQISPSLQLPHSPALESNKALRIYRELFVSSVDDLFKPIPRRISIVGDAFGIELLEQPCKRIWSLFGARKVTTPQADA